MTERRAGRPRSASRELLEDAAFELFLENGYAGTSVDQITQRAGVSRSTFFNYFPAKADVFWLDTDRALAEVAVAVSEGADPVEAVRSVASGFGPARVPWLLTQLEVVGSSTELASTAMDRLLAAVATLSAAPAWRSLTVTAARVRAFTVVGAVIAAAQEWAAAGTARGQLLPYLDGALDSAHGV